MNKNENHPVSKGVIKTSDTNSVVLAAGAENIVTERNRPFLFEIEPFFSAMALDSTDRNIFTHGQPATTKDHLIHFCTFENPYLENELRGFVRHLVKDEDMAASTLQPVMTSFVGRFEDFVKEYLPGYVSISDYDFESLYAAYTEYLFNNGYTLICKGPSVVDGDMNRREYCTKNQKLYLIRRFYQFIADTVRPDTRPEFLKDIWDIRKLGVPYSTQADRSRYTINFSRISQLWFRDVVKKYVFYRVQRRKMSAVLDDMKAFNCFSEFLRKKRPDIDDFRMINRDVIVDFKAYLLTYGYVKTTYNRRLSVMKTFFETGICLNFEGFPTKKLIKSEDFVKTVCHLPKFFSENELKQMNEHLQDLPKQYGRIMFVLENCGMRLSDILGTPIMNDGKLCIQRTDSGFIFTYFMPKVRRTNTIPVNTLVGEVILSAIEESRQNYGEDCVYIFAKSVAEPISRSVFLRAMNEMSKKYDLRKDNGDPLRIRGHAFRGTVATQYANSGIHLDLIRLMLGQQEIGVLKHYITIHSDTMTAYMDPIIQENEALIQNIGNVDADIFSVSENDLMLPLPNGRCGRKSSESCKKANACYRCRMFHPQKQFIDTYKMQLQEAERNICMARAEGYDRILADNEDLADRLKEIILSLEE